MGVKLFQPRKVGRGVLGRTEVSHGRPSLPFRTYVDRELGEPWTDDDTRTPTFLEGDPCVDVSSRTASLLPMTTSAVCRLMYENLSRRQCIYLGFLLGLFWNSFI